MTSTKRTPWMTISVTTIVVLVVIAVLIPAWQGFRPRSLVTEAMEDAVPLRRRIERFHIDNRRLPEGTEAASFRIDQGLSASRLVAWDPRERMVVVTMGDNMHSGKRFGFKADLNEARIEWKCSRFDLEAKYLPASCR